MRSQQPRGEAVATAAHPKQRRCDVCECYVGATDSLWQQHVAGIRHRRNALSLKVHGERGHHVVSVFERLEDGAAQAAAGCSRDPAAHGAAASSERRASHAGASTSGTSTALGEAPNLRRLQRDALAQVAMSTSVTLATYRQAAARFSLDQLAAAWGRLAAEAQHLAARREPTCQQCTAAAEACGAGKSTTQQQPQQQQPQQQQPQQQQQQQQAAAGGDEAAPGAAAADGVASPRARQRKQRRPRRAAAGPAACRHHLVLPCGSARDGPPAAPPGPRAAAAAWQAGAADIACLALALQRPCGPLAGAASLDLCLPYHTAGPEAAAVTAACALLARALGQAPAARRLRLSFRRPDYLAILAQGGVGLGAVAPMWRHVLGALRQAVEVNACLTDVTLEAPPCTWDACQLVELQVALHATPLRQRRVLAAGLHPRTGARCPLRLLPPDLAAAVLDWAVPPGPRQLVLCLQQPMAVPGGSSSSEDGSSDSETTSSSTTTTSSDSETSSSDGDDEAAAPVGGVQLLQPLQPQGGAVACDLRAAAEAAGVAGQQHDVGSRGGRGGGRRGRGRGAGRWRGGGRGRMGSRS